LLVLVDFLLNKRFFERVGGYHFLAERGYVPVASGKLSFTHFLQRVGGLTLLQSTWPFFYYSVFNNNFSSFSIDIHLSIIQSLPGSGGGGQPLTCCGRQKQRRKLGSSGKWVKAL
jgi:hypothetical protein